jgi:valyl-tRNA synthetase
MSRPIPERYDFLACERDWQRRWEELGIHRWDPTRPREETFVVDTPPPTVSGSLHVGHVFSYTHQDLLARYQRMCGRNIFYPMGWDDNGLPTERRVQNVFGIRCDPTLPYDPSWKPRRDKGDKEPVEEVSRRNFIEACGEITAEDERAFEDLWRHLALSIDWQQQYATIDANCRRVSQLSFLDLVDKRLVSNLEAPTMWDVDFKTAVAQAEVEDREKGGAMHDIRFGVEGGGELVIATTRPELLAACIAVVAHPDDARYQGLFGKHAITPLFGARVPILAAEHADPEKGTGILMVCTFGDGNDVEFWRRAGLPLKQVVGLDGRMSPVRFGEAPFDSVDPDRAAATWAELRGLYVNQARKRSAELLAESGALIGEPKPVMQAVKFYEKGDRPLELVPTRQWFVSILAHKQALLEQGRKIQWHPEHMRTRYEHWVEGLNQDWCISRQRYFGVPFPVWYPIDAEGVVRYEQPIYADAASLPVDPLSDIPTGYRADQRNQPGGFAGDPDVMDTWATSSLSPQIMSHWGSDPARHQQLFPMDIRPQSHEIIRTWAFYTIVKAWMHENQIPWRHVVISGWILDPDRKKMSKSKGNVVTPDALLEQHSVDGVRYWAGRARLGADTAFDEKVFGLGKRLATKVFNASRFVLLQIERVGSAPVDAIAEPLDLALVGELRRVVAEATQAFDRFDYAAALQVAEASFWGFCDHYLELVKNRAYDEVDSPARRSAVATLELGLRTYLRLLAPFLPYVTDEVWSWRFATEAGRDRSVHTAAWPTSQELAAVAAPAQPRALELAIEVLTAARGAKSSAQKNLKWPIERLEIRADAARLEAIEAGLGDLARTVNVAPENVALVADAALADQDLAIEAALAASEG